jgi:hypothetical protein
VCSGDPELVRVECFLPAPASALVVEKPKAPRTGMDQYYDKWANFDDEEALRTQKERDLNAS